MQHKFEYILMLSILVLSICAVGIIHAEDFHYDNLSNVTPHGVTLSDSQKQYYTQQSITTIGFERFNANRVLNGYMPLDAKSYSSRSND